MTSPEIDMKTSVAEGSALTRMPYAMPLAAILTAGLMLMMAGLIATEFQPQDSGEALAFEINPVETLLDIRPVIDTPDPYETVETPPAPPVLDIDRAGAVTEKVITLASAKPVFKLPVIDIGPGTIAVPDTDEQPLVRIPPVMPTRFTQGRESGFCLMRFSVSPEGQPFDVTASACTHKSLERASQKAVLQWKYNPKIRDGRPVSRRGVETKIRFDLADERGRKLPLPDGF